jgi:hypothetical protein
MIKITIKTLSVIILLLILIIFYLSFFGIKTDKFNDNITNKILKINKNVNLKLEKVNFLLDPYNFTVNVMTVNPKIYFEDNQLEIKSIKTNISLKALLDRQFLIDDLKILTNEIKINDAILLAKSFRNSTELFLLNRFIKDGYLTLDIKLNFDKAGNIKPDYQINGFIKKGEFKFLSQFKIKNLNFNFEINKNQYSLTEIKTELNGIKLLSQLIQINERKDLFLVKGNIATMEKNLDVEELSILLGSFLKNLDIKNIRLSTANNFSFNLNKKLKFNDLNIESQVILNQLDIRKNSLILKSYLPVFNETIKFENHKIKIKYNKKNFDINGNGKVLIDKKSDSIIYQVSKRNNKFLFDTKLNLKNKKIIIDFLDYEKKEGIDSSISIKGNFEKDNKILFDSISFKEKNNKFLVKNLNLDKDYKISSIDVLDANYLNNENLRNQFILKRNKSNYTIVGESFDATKLINTIVDGEDKNSPIFTNFNSIINIKINKTYIDKINFIKNLSGVLNFKNNEIIEAKLDSIFSNQEKINLLISINNKKEKITRLTTNYPKPLIKRYSFIKGFEDGYLNYYSVKKNGVSNSLLVIDNFKVKEVPVFAKLLSLASLQGIADLLTGEGIRFSNFEMRFSNEKKLTTIEELYAIGPAVSILMDGYIESKKTISLRGTLVPATTINRSISSIPLLGKILVGKKTGEGVFGVSFKIKGPPKDLSTTVNPIKTLTPRFITRTLEKIKKN